MDKYISELINREEHGSELVVRFNKHIAGISKDPVVCKNLIWFGIISEAYGVKKTMATVEYDLINMTVDNFIRSVALDVGKCSGGKLSDVNDSLIQTDIWTLFRMQNDITEIVYE